MAARRHHRHRHGPVRRAFRAVSSWPLRVKLAIFAAVLAGLILGIRHYHAASPAPPAMLDRGPMLRAAAQQLRDDPEIADVVYVPARDQWNVTPSTPSGIAQDFARYVCTDLVGAGVIGPHTSVRVIDAAQLAANGFDYGAAATSTVICTQEEER